MCWMKKERRSPVVSGSMMGRLPAGRPIIALAAAACAILAVPAAAQELGKLLASAFHIANDTHAITLSNSINS